MNHLDFTIDRRVGIGLRSAHADALMAANNVLSWVEVHSENWLAESGPVAQRLEEIRGKYDVSLHGVGMSLGSADRLDMDHLRRLRRLIARCDPVLVSEHLSWGSIAGVHSNDLLPLPYDAGTVRLLAERIDEVQQFLGRELLVENLSSYCTFESSTMPEWVFVSEIVERAQCGLLLDINNVYVNSQNHGFDAASYLAAMPWSRVKEIHLGGYEAWENVLIDTHGRPVQTPVWRLFDSVQHLLVPEMKVLIEWDTDLPTLDVLLGEAAKASAMMARHEVIHA